MGPSYNVLIIGAGKIGALFDFSDSKEILTHAHAFSKSKKFNLLGFFDVNREKAEIAAVRWKVKAFESLKEAFNSFNIDVLCIAAPDDCHHSILKELIKFPIKLVFVEKPFAITLEEADEIIRLYETKRIPLAVNYSRRFVPEITKYKSEYDSGSYGKYVSGIGYYGKGVLHNGSHLLDFLNYFFEGIKDKSLISGICDFYENDPSITAILELEEKKPFFLQAIDCNLYTIFEVDLLFEKKRIKISDARFSAEIYNILDDNVYEGYRNIVKVKEEKISLSNALYFAALNIYNHLSKGEKLKCSAMDAYKAMKDCLELKKMFENG